MHISRDIELRFERCSKCARWWAVELHVDAKCPACARETIRSLEDQEVVFIEDSAEQERKMSALRGVITRLKRRLAEREG